MRGDLERLTDISTAIDRILSKTAQGRSIFERDEMLQVWVLHHLQIVGEAARCLSEEFRRLHPDPVWSKAAGMRHILVHHYFEIDAGEIWKVVERGLQPLRELVRVILGRGEKHRSYIAVALKGRSGTFTITPPQNYSVGSVASIILTK